MQNINFTLLTFPKPELLIDTESIYNDLSNEIIEHKEVDNPKNSLEKQRQYNKTFYLKHKDEMLTTILCSCGGKYSTYTLRNHERTKRHLNHLKPV